jgi:hypothetical protein
MLKEPYLSTICTDKHQFIHSKIPIGSKCYMFMVANTRHEDIDKKVSYEKSRLLYL